MYQIIARGPSSDEGELMGFPGSKLQLKGQYVLTEFVFEHYYDAMSCMSRMSELDPVVVPSSHAEDMLKVQNEKDERQGTRVVIAENI